MVPTLFQLKSLKEQGVDTAEVETRLNAELDEWRTDRNAINAAKVAAERFEIENRNLQREMLSIQVNYKCFRGRTSVQIGRKCVRIMAHYRDNGEAGVFWYSLFGNTFTFSYFRTIFSVPGQPVNIWTKNWPVEFNKFNYQAEILEEMITKEFGTNQKPKFIYIDTKQLLELVEQW